MVSSADTSDTSLSAVDSPLETSSDSVSTAELYSDAVSEAD